jgi:hypothetical protein
MCALGLGLSLLGIVIKAFGANLCAVHKGCILVVNLITEAE